MTKRAYYPISGTFDVSGKGLKANAGEIFIFDDATGETSIAGSLINTFTYNAYDPNFINNSNAAGTQFASAWNGSDALKQFSNESCKALRSGRLYDGTVTGYVYKVKRATQVFHGTTKKFTLPVGANVIVRGLGQVGESYRQRLVIAGLELSQLQASQVPEGYPMLSNGTFLGKVMATPSEGGTWFVDTGIGNNNFIHHTKVAIGGNVMGSQA